ncbi:hypothetical protein R6Q59_016220 [Mikania micrantha]
MTRDAPNLIQRRADQGWSRQKRSECSDGQKDGVAFCLDSADLLGKRTHANGSSWTLNYHTRNSTKKVAFLRFVSPWTEGSKSVKRGNVVKESIVQESKIFFSTGSTKIVEEMHAANISVYVSGFSTETLSMMLDFYSDPYIELISFLAEGIDGVITDNPKTASAFMRSPCVDPNSTAPFVFNPIKPGDYLAQVEPAVLPPSAPPLPPLQVSDVVDPPLPPVNVSARKEGSDSGENGGSNSSKSGDRRLVDVVTMSLLLIELVLVIGLILC